MMLSDVDIKAAIASGELEVEPFRPSAIRPACLTLHFGETLLRPKPGVIVDVQRGITPEYEKMSLSDDKPYALQPGDFILGATYEKVTVGQKLAVMIEGRSTLARLGLTIVQTAMLVYPGHSGRAITLELANHGANPIMLYPKMKIARAAIIELKTPAAEQYDTTGKYASQDDVGPPIFKQEIWVD